MNGRSSLKTFATTTAVLATVFAALALGGKQDDGSSTTEPSGRGRTAPRTIVVAHRGDHTAAHENSIEAIRRAIQYAGADYVELDVRTTRDGELVLMHDATVDRTTDGHGRVDVLTFAEIAGLRLVDPQRPHLPPSKVPRLAEALAELQGKAGLYLDFKSGDRAKVVQLLRDYRMVNSTVVYDERDAFRLWKTLEPALRTMTSPKPEDLSAESLPTLKARLQVDILDGPVTLYTPALVREAQRHGLAVWPDIQGPHEDAAFWDKTVSLLADGYQTDRPADFVRFLVRRGLRRTH
ncbi:MAG: glycerophosphodiester phosphodiesterase family protein [Verrucomicrobiota bacterium]|nr:glycerophosphodiester phosphodiesterase family protein [Verrucomicrobiota bacterium]